MAIKDLPTAIGLDFTQLIFYAQAYGNDLSTIAAGPKPKVKAPVAVFLKNDTAVTAATTLTNWYTANVKSVVIPQKTDKNILTWPTPVSVPDANFDSAFQSNFFTIRTYLANVLQQGDPILSAYDACWASYQQVTGSWGLKK
jgi:hypothetical protein